jgi:hypothetical protein
METVERTSQRRLGVSGPRRVTTSDENSVRRRGSLDPALLRSCPEPIYGETPMPSAAVAFWMTIMMVFWLAFWGAVVFVAVRMANRPPSDPKGQHQCPPSIVSAAAAGDRTSSVQ